ncbi:redoxin family protein [Pseudoduganella sp. DS3]|uniref:Redoxin family protein n=1 Tax=Pseudoduganella guangdongensis TaxID=2692179 RepID=A0A6N9HC68_9BURK|nr:TlpA disulfide reductase family protein [Pseudoduganella guangdongensis]MYN01094.1 redoxin family protein [Pseudoduganella guangdongensis]
MSTGSRAWIKPLIALAVIAGIGFTAYQSLNKHQAAPAVTFLGIKGEKITPESLKGKVFMVNFWATSCTTCVAEMPDMVKTYDKYKGQGLEYVAVAMQYDAPNYVVNFTETRKLPFKVALDVSGEAAKAWGDVKMTPTVFVVDKDGNIIKRYLGKVDFPSLHALLEKNLKS